MEDILYIHPCTVCGEPTGFTFDVPGSCGPCTPHVCTPELPEDRWCDFCGSRLADWEYELLDHTKLGTDEEV